MTGSTRASRSKLAQEYPPRFCEEMLIGLQEHMQEHKQSHVVHCVLTVEALNMKDEEKESAGPWARRVLGDWFVCYPSSCFVLV